MGHIKQTRSGRWQLALVNKLLPKGRAWLTFDSQPEAEQYSSQAEKWLAAGLVPPELADPTPRDRAELLGPVIRAWVNSGEPSAADAETLNRLFVEVGATPFNQINYDWCERWVRKLKLERNLAPGSIRKRVQALSRALDWHLRKVPTAMVGNPLHMLPRGYSTYNAKEARELEAMGKEPKVDQERDRRLSPDEEAAIRAAMDGIKRDDRERALSVDPDLQVLFTVILGTGMRLREAYRLRVGQVDLVSKTLTPQASKAWYGRVRFRGIPMQPSVHKALAGHLAGRAGAAPAELVFRYWDGTEAGLAPTTSRLSARFSSTFAYAGVDGLTEHDLRHEATCRWFEMRGADGGWLYRSEEINRIMGWAPNSKMALRYASFRATDLASRMWPAPAAARSA